MITLLTNLRNNTTLDLILGALDRTEALRNFFEERQLEELHDILLELKHRAFNNTAGSAWSTEHPSVRADKLLKERT